jgi:tetratricopeptide (TPR) repeat protein
LEKAILIGLSKAFRQPFFFHTSWQIPENIFLSIGNYCVFLQIEMSNNMSTSRIIKIFLASSEEMEIDRNAFGNLIRRLDKIYEQRGIRIELFEWEDYDAAYNDRRKQDEYNDRVRASDMFLALFHTKAGEFTIEEFDVATEEFRRTGIKPKSYVYMRDLQPGEEESAELTAFKKRLFEEMGHYWSRYNNRDSMQLHFVMQLQLVESSRSDALKVENGEVKLGDMTVARMENLQFAAGNEDYQRMSHRLQELPALIEKARLRTEKYPDDDDLKDELQKLLDERNALQEELDKQQELLFDTAKRIAQLQGELITDRMRRAIEAFDSGNVREANIILDEAEKDAEHNLNDYRKSKEIAEHKRQNVINSIEELLLKTSTLLADLSIPIAERIEKVAAIYAQADNLAKEVDYDEEKYDKLLYDYGDFLYKYGQYNDALEIRLREMVLSEKIFGAEHSDTAASYNNIGVVYHNKGDYDKALEYHFKALAIKEKVFGTEHPSTATSYNNIGAVYDDKGDYDKALEYHLKALAIKEKVLGTEHPSTATSYNSIGGMYINKGDYDKALEYYLKALAIYEKVLGTEHPHTAASYNNIGSLYYEMKKYPEALEYFEKALRILKSRLEDDHPNVQVVQEWIVDTKAAMGDTDVGKKSFWHRLIGRHKIK